MNTFIHSLLSEVSQLQKIQCVWIERDNANPGEREIINPRHIISIKPQIMFTLKAPVGPNDEDVDVDDFDVFFKHISDYTRSRMTDNYPFVVIT